VSMVPPLTYAQAMESLRGQEQQLEARKELLYRATARIKALEAENAALREDKARLEATNGHLGELACQRHDRILQLERDLVNEKSSHAWTEAREKMALDAARKGTR
jgi:hypothetical protein